jgi:hypothetical protein
MLGFKMPVSRVAWLPTGMNHQPAGMTPNSCGRVTLTTGESQ